MIPKSTTPYEIIHVVSEWQLGRCTVTDLALILDVPTPVLIKVLESNKITNANGQLIDGKTCQDIRWVIMCQYVIHQDRAIAEMRHQMQAMRDDLTAMRKTQVGN